MIQILGLRTYTDKKTNKEKNAEKFFERGWRAESIEYLLANYTEILKNIPEEEQYNLYFTVADCHEESGRKLKLQHHIAIDIDGMHIKENEDGSIDESCFTPVIEAFEKVTGITRDKIGIVFSGNGLWFYIRMSEPISDPDYFKQTALFYKAFAESLNLEFRRRYLQCKTDTTAWSGARLARMPGTWNIKPDKPKRKAYVVQPNIEEVNVTIKTLAKLPEIKPGDTVNYEAIKSVFGDPDDAEIMHPERGCHFMYWAFTHPEQLNEAQWFAALGIAGRFPNGEARCHEMSKGHPNYTHEETANKYLHAMNYGPRTCQNIESLSDKCKNCKHRNTKLSSPIAIRGEDHIKTQNTGFYNMRLTKDGSLVPGKPAYADLVKYFKKEKGVFFCPEGEKKCIWVFNGMFYTSLHEDYIEHYALKHFKHGNEGHIRAEFFKQVRLFNIKNLDALSNTVRAKMNFKNGVLDIPTRTLLPHSPDYYFRSALTCEYNQDAIAPNWYKFIDDVTAGDQELKDVLQEYVGYALASVGCEYQKALVLYGSGSNGKSIFVDVIKALVGNDGFSALSLTEMQDDNSRLALTGKLINISEENDANTSFKDASYFKKMVTGGEVTVKKLYSDRGQYKNITKFFVLWNKFPRSNDDSDGFYRRLIIVPFLQKFSDELGNRDLFILDKLVRELPGILNWALDGYDRLVKQGKFTESKACKKMLDQYTEDSSDMQRFLDEALEFSEHSVVSRKDIYDAFKEWCFDEGIDTRYYSNQKVFSAVRAYYRAKKFKDPEETMARDMGEQVRVFKGMSLLKQVKGASL